MDLRYNSALPPPLLQLTLIQISIPPSQTVEVAKLLSKTPVQLTGLGARDSLRLEAGMCLYGHDLDETTSPIEAGLSWVIGEPTYNAIHTLMNLLFNRQGQKRDR